ncbi:HET-domain-containing protein [Macroventuria anomochaeta]|uniref:HET-domain-containing protein n=1 Tax=Macroventuria anomochaeta TaxID=301207 RepID=A0ACB6RKJ8_9PLEO|nr:HET-domain-containing protein [Macroventuria anomochaeta]KAF2622323.1 HET-domain-containing protein [Macroventuria anomochaeta]
MMSIYLGQLYPGTKLAPRTIRLVAIKPGVFGDPISCTLETVSLDDHPHYRALSYTWGDTRHKRHISLNGNLFVVNQDLHAALRRLRHEQKWQTYWIDMLCINQADFDERSEQVVLMPKIYSKAKQVVFWLADTTNDTTDNKMELTPTQVYAAKAFLERLERDPSYQATEVDLVHEEILDTISSILACSWWTRVWTVQEAILPLRAILLMGPVHIQWETLVRAARNFMAQLEQNSLQHPPAYLHVMLRLYQQVTVIEWIRELRYSKEHLKLSFLLHAFRSRLCTDSRDKLFAFLGLVSELSIYARIIPDYKLSTSEVLGTIFEKLIPLEDNLNLLVRQKEGKRRLNLPTWMPDLTAEVDPRQSDLHMYVMYNLPRFFNASHRKPQGTLQMPSSPWKVDERSKCLSVQGLPFDKILEVSRHDPQRLPLKDEEHVEFLQTVLNDFKDPKKVYARNRGLPYNLWCLVNFDQIVIKPPEGTISVQIRTRKIKPDDYFGHTPPIQPLGVMAEFLPLFSCFTTEKGYIGLGPHDMKEGDDVCILLGADVPFVLRPTRGGEKHEYVGHCFVQGIMDGEALEGIVFCSSLFLKD